MLKYLPNTITLLNLVFGCLGILQACKGNIYAAEHFLWTGLVLDFFDGLVARLLKSSSAIGKQLDSLADVVTAGVLPGLMLYHAIENGIHHIDSKVEFYKYLHNVAFLIPAFSALRLAKFNLDDSQIYHFKGMPTPACALMVAAIASFKKSNISPHFIHLLKHPIFLSSLSIFLSLLLVSKLKFLAFKFNGVGWNKNKYIYLFGVLSLTLLFIFKKEGLIISLLFYIILALCREVYQYSKDCSKST